MRGFSILPVRIKKRHEGCVRLNAQEMKRTQEGAPEILTVQYVGA